MGIATQLLSVGPSQDRGKERRNNLSAGIALLVILAIAIAAVLYVSGWLTDDDEPGEEAGQSQAARSDPDPTDGDGEGDTDEGTADEPEDEADGEDAGDDEDADEEQPAPPPGEDARLTFTAPGEAWTPNPDMAGLLPDGTAHSLVSQVAFDGENDWLAVLMSGDPPGDQASAPDGIAEHTAQVSRWFAEAGFPADVEIEELDSSSITVDGRPAHLLHERFDFDIDGLDADSETVWTIVVDLGPDRPRGVFIAAVPDTDGHLGDEVSNVLDSLQITDG